MSQGYILMPIPQALHPNQAYTFRDPRGSGIHKAALLLTGLSLKNSHALRSLPST